PDASQPVDTVAGSAVALVKVLGRSISARGQAAHQQRDAKQQECKDAWRTPSVAMQERDR
ncbi:MAG TPA: hypothetical protein VK973_16070, partial [Arenicellales bacterium]|nr:hypothetical protein [Arenicellales bacterium]